MFKILNSSLLKSTQRTLFRPITIQVRLLWVRVIVFNSTFNNISAISWWSVSLMDEIGVPGENH